MACVCCTKGSFTWFGNGRMTANFASKFRWGLLSLPHIGSRASARLGFNVIKSPMIGIDLSSSLACDFSSKPLDCGIFMTSHSASRMLPNGWMTLVASNFALYLRQASTQSTRVHENCLLNPDRKDTGMTATVAIKQPLTSNFHGVGSWCPLWSNVPQTGWEIRGLLTTFPVTAGSSTNESIRHLDFRLILCVHSSNLFYHVQ